MPVCLSKKPFVPVQRKLSLLLPLLLLILFALQTRTVFADDPQTCGSSVDDCTWTFDASTGVLTISGSGQMTNYGNGNQPWYRLKDSITTVKIDGVKNIGSHAFFNFPLLGSVTIGPSVTEIGMHAISKCSGLSIVKFEGSSSLDTIGDLAFNECTALTEIGLPKSLRTIEGSAFLNCSSLRSVTIPDGTVTIGVGAFNGCRSLTTFSIPASVTSIGRNPFLDCSALGSITVDPGNPAYKSVDGALFSHDGDALNTLISFPMGKGGSYSIPAGVKTIGASAFSGCSGLTSLIIPESVTEIGDNAFSNCSGLTSLIIPESVTEIGEFAFSGCSNLTSLTIPDSVTNIGIYFVTECSRLKSLTFLRENPPALSVFSFDEFPSGCKIFIRNRSYLYQWPGILNNNNSTVISRITTDLGITFSSEPAKHTYDGVDYYEAGSTITLNVPAGYAAEAEWYDGESWHAVSPDSSGVSSFTMPDEDMKLTGSVNIITYTLAYKLNGGALPQGLSNPASYTVERETIILNDPVQEGHLFGGWYETPEFTGSPVTEIPHGSTGNMTLHARWLLPVTLTAESRAVTYDTSEHVVTGFSSSVPGLTFPGVHAEGRGTDVGSYAVTFPGVTLGKTEDSTGKYVVTETVEGILTVEKAENPAIIEAEDYLSKGGHTLDLKDLVRNAAGDVSFTLTEANGCTLSGTVLTSGDLTGDCIVEVSIAGDKNHKPASGTLTVKVIDKATGTLTVTQQGTTYGTPLPDPVWQDQTETLSERVSYSGHLHDGSAYGPSAEKPTQAGQYTVEVVVETRSVIYFGSSEVFTIERKAVTVHAENKGKKQGEADPELTASVRGLLNGDSVRYELSRDAGEEPGRYVIHVSGETLQGNYQLTFTPGTLTISESGEPDPEDPEEETTDLPVRFYHVDQSGNPGVPKDVKEQKWHLRFVLRRGDEVWQSVKADPLVLTPGQDKQMITVSFSGKLDPAELSHDYDVKVSGYPAEAEADIYMTGGQLLKSYRITVGDRSFIHAPDLILTLWVRWDDGTGWVYEEPEVHALPEDEIGAYKLNKDGTKEYLLFHTYDICMAWLGDDNLCRGYDRCFHKESPYVNPFVKP